MTNILCFFGTVNILLKNNSYVYSFLTAIFLSAGAYSQVLIQGIVVDTENNPVTGASVVIKSTTTGISTGVDGRFSLTIRQALPVIVRISLLGYKAQETELREARSAIRIVLQEEASVLDEVVVVGYGTQRRRELTGAVATVNKNLLAQQNASIDGLLGGAVAGVNVTRTSGQPGAGSEIRIRGGNSIHASNEPLYVIDGFIYFSEQGATEAGVSGISSSLNPLASINPSDIESIEILKDVSAKAIYGSRGANGVIIVTTKKGLRGKNVVHYQYSSGVDKPAKRLNLLNATQWLDIHNNPANGNFY
jgi:TonB-dependent SusC/RagA subfamily outer membrane receptor